MQNKTYLNAKFIELSVLCNRATIIMCTTKRCAKFFLCELVSPVKKCYLGLAMRYAMVFTYTLLTLAALQND